MDLEYVWVVRTLTEILCAHETKELAEKCIGEYTVSIEWTEISANYYHYINNGKTEEEMYLESVPMCRCGVTGFKHKERTKPPFSSI